MPDFDLAVVGAGSAGLSITAVAAQLGLRVALIERDRMGGDCLNAGCVPSKALLAAGHAAQAGAAAARFGVRFPAPEIDWARVREHVAGVVAAIAPADSQERFERLGATVLRCEARFAAPDALVADGRRITARRIVIAAGSRAAVPDIKGLQAVPYLTNETLFGLREQPSHLIILGGGAIGLEMAQAHAGLGCAVTIVEAGSLAGPEDPDLVAVLRRTLLGQGVTIHEGARVVRAEAGPALVLEDGRRIAGSHLLVATGRRPNLETLDCEAGGIRTSAGGIVTDTGLRSVSNRRVFAAGDIADPTGLGPRRFTHVGSYHASIVIRRAVFRLPARLDYASLSRVIYTAPELAQVGLTEAEARRRGAVRVLTWTLAENDRAQTERDTAGLAKIVATPGGRVLGAGMVGAHAGEMINACALAMARRIPLSALANMIVAYPTRAETFKRAAGRFYAPRLFSTASKQLARALNLLP